MGVPTLSESHQMFLLLQYAGGIENRQNQWSPVLNLRLKKTWAGKSRDYRDVIVFEKLCFKIFSVYTKRKNGVFNFLRFETFSKSSALNLQRIRISVDGRALSL